MPALRTLPWAFTNKSCGGMAPGRAESHYGTQFQNSLMGTCAKEHGMEWVHHIPCQPAATSCWESCNGLLKTSLKTTGAGTCKTWEAHSAQATWLLHTRGSVHWAGCAQSKLPGAAEGGRDPVGYTKNMKGRCGLVLLQVKANPPLGLLLPRDLNVPGARGWESLKATPCSK